MKRIWMLAAPLMAATLAACASGPATYDGSVQTRTIQEYQLGPGDRIQITVFGEPELSGEFVIDGSGVISMPLVGDINVLKRSVREAQQAIEAKLAEGYLREPRVAAEVLNYRPYYILGEVNEPGEYPYSNNLTVLNAVATAGGFTYRANQQVVMIKEADSEEEIRMRFSADTAVAPGDTLRILERVF
ncbi:MAG: polysaccharide biosynthesis/export family protein [Pseudomonadota bacterium]